MQNETNTKAEIIALLEGRTQVSLENIRQFILNLDERDYMEFLYPSDPDFTEELGMNVSRLTPRHANRYKVEDTGCVELRPYQKCTKRPRIEGKEVDLRAKAEPPKERKC